MTKKSQEKKLLLKLNKPDDPDAVIQKPMWNLPFRLLVVGKSLISGKTNAISNLLLRPYNNDDVIGQMFYRKDFKAEHIYLVCKTADLDDTWKVIIKEKGIPLENVSYSYDEEKLQAFYNNLEANFHEAKEKGEQPPHVLICFDDMSFGGQLKHRNFGVITQMFCNGRHLRLSVIITAQKFSHILTDCRENMSGAIFFGCTNKQLALIEEDINQLDTKKAFFQMFKEATKEKHSSLFVRFDDGLDPGKMYYDQNGDPLF